jgi:hypothetical protein
MHIRIASMLLLAGLACEAALAQTPPPPKVVAPAITRPRIMDGKLDLSLCNYPAKAVRADLEGCCRMQVDVSADGKAGKMTGQCTDDIFYEPSKACLAPQVYLPAMKAGKPIRETGNIVVEYRMAAPATPPVVVLLERLFPSFKKPPPPEPEDDICKKRPDDMIAALDRLRGG